MGRPTVSLCIILFTASVAVADVLNFRFPKLTNLVTIEHTLTTERDYPDLVFYLISDDSKH